MKPSLDITAVRAALTAHTAEIATALLGNPNFRLSNNRELRFRRKGSLAVVITGARAGNWFDHENGIGGDLFSLICRTVGGSVFDAVEYCERNVGCELTRSALQTSDRREDDADASQNRRYAGSLWQNAVSIADTVASDYLRRRGIIHLGSGFDRRVLRFHPSCPYGGTRHPCLLALMVDLRTNEPRAIQRTALTQTGDRIGRMALGPKTGAAIKLSADEDVTMGLAIGEGMETVLSAMQLGFTPAWALGDASNLRHFPVVSGIGCLTIIVDNDESGTGQRAALECSSRWTSAGREVFRVIPDRCGEDINDVVQRTVA